MHLVKMQFYLEFGFTLKYNSRHQLTFSLKGTSVDLRVKISTLILYIVFPVGDCAFPS
jgi:hypothetical protein